MNFLGRIISFFGVMAGLIYIAQRAVAKLYEDTFHRKEIYDEEYTIPKKQR